MDIVPRLVRILRKRKMEVDAADFGKLGERLGRDIMTGGSPARHVVNLPVVLVELGALRLGIALDHASSDLFFISLWWLPGRPHLRHRFHQQLQRIPQGSITSLRALVMPESHHHQVVGRNDKGVLPARSRH
jgi:hypothetical protein